MNYTHLKFDSLTFRI